MAKKSKTSIKIDTRRPRMFSDNESMAEKMKTATRIADLKNFGPATEVHFHKAGIKTIAKLQKLGWKKAMTLLVKTNPKTRHSLFTYALIGALTNREWFKITEEEKLEAREFTTSLKPKKK